MTILNRKKLLISSILLLFYLCLYSQDIEQKRSYSYSTKYFYGYILPHSQAIKALSSYNPSGIEVDIIRLNNSDSDYYHCNCKSLTGLNIAFYNFGNPKILGNAVCINGFVEPLLLYNTKIKIGLRLGAGTAFLNKVYDEVHNPDNLFFSSKLSFTLITGFRFLMPLNENIFLEASTFFNHISNGGIKQPNKGMNYPGFSLGINYFPKTMFFPNINKANNDSKFYSLYLRSFFSGKVHDKTNDMPLLFCPISGISSVLTYNTGLMSVITLSLAAEYDTYLLEKLRRKGNNYKSSFITNLLLGYGLRAGNFTLLFQNGINLLYPANEKNIWVQQYDLFYKINNNFTAGVYLKANKHVANHMGISVMYKLKQWGSLNYGSF